jgi:mevalonate kinase
VCGYNVIYIFNHFHMLLLVSVLCLVFVSKLHRFLLCFLVLCRFKPANVVVTSELPVGSCLGSSAIFCMALPC